MEDKLAQAVEVLKNGGIVIFPTDTAFGIGCRIDNEKSIERLFKLRKRPLTKASPVLVSSVEMAQEYLAPIDDLVFEKLIKPHWPGPLTIVLNCRIEKVPSMVRGGGNTLGVRMPDNSQILEIIRTVGVPILGSSANFVANPTPYSFKDLDPDLVKLVDFVMPGNCSIKQASTVIDCSSNNWKVLRQGITTIN